MAEARETKDVKPENTEHVNLKVRGADGQEVWFKIKSSTRLQKLMEAYAQRQSVAVDSIRFLFDGQRIRADSTPQELGMENEDEIDAMVEQVGGESRT